MRQIKTAILRTEISWRSLVLTPRSLHCGPRLKLGSTFDRIRMTDVLVRSEFYDSSYQQDMFATQNIDYLNDESRKDKKHLSLGMLVPDAIQYICAEGQALRWDDSASCYEVIPAI